MEAVTKPIPGFEDFLREVNSEFSVTGESGYRADFRLVEANELFSSSHLHSFSLMFCTPATGEHRQGIYSLQHDRLGEMELFLVPVAQTDEGLFYEASFNLVREAAN